MLKQLRFKFVIINMLLVTVMLAVILGTVVHFTRENLESQSIQMLQSIADNPFQLGRPDQFQQEIRLPYFTVQINHRGDVIATGGGYYDLSDEALLLQITDAALCSEDTIGILTDYGLRFCKRDIMGGQLIVFADISSEQQTLTDLIAICVFVFVLSFGVFLVISLLLARWAVKPVAQAWEQQRQFVTDASHELKTPLTVITTSAELLQNPEYDEAAREQFASSILTMARQMRFLVEGLLDLTRVDNGAVRTAFSKVALSRLVMDGTLPFEPLFFEKDLILESSIEDGITITGSAAHLEQVLKILLDNAIKYSCPGTVCLSLKKQGNHCQLCVSNPGPELSQEDLKNIFKRFYRVDKARSRDGSYGLGLAIAESIVTEHGGKIWAESADSRNLFHIQLPLN